jgi:hypothetical protein
MHVGFALIVIKRQLKLSGRKVRTISMDESEGFKYHMLALRDMGK